MKKIFKPNYVLTRLFLVGSPFILLATDFIDQKSTPNQNSLPSQTELEPQKKNGCRPQREDDTTNDFEEIYGREIPQGCSWRGCPPQRRETVTVFFRV
ncbi:hypothetical protein AVEN_34612-1 [Araneus ventricosus]|uniref:Uncharacterized protein n=1 Tax=Araneus ventricosus TaxID=182803 RepID=A0A4Y2B2Y9_ARAVE|nr:hypothetical protein AVEN_34612-1 [Araneus ventricosus]